MSDGWTVLMFVPKLVMSLPSAWANATSSFQPRSPKAVNVVSTIWGSSCAGGLPAIEPPPCTCGLVPPMALSTMTPVVSLAATVVQYGAHVVGVCAVPSISEVPDTLTAPRVVRAAGGLMSANSIFVAIPIVREAPAHMSPPLVTSPVAVRKYT